MQKLIPIEFRTKKYIKGYLISKYGSKIIMSKKDLIGSKLYDLLQHRDTIDRDEDNSLLNCSIKIYISYHSFKHRGGYLNSKNLKIFNIYISRLIKEDFYFQIDFYLKIHLNFINALKETRLKLGIDEEDWSDDSMKKDYYRYRKKNNLPLLYSKFDKNEPDDIPSK